MERIINIRLPASACRTCPVVVSDRLHLGRQIRKAGVTGRLAVISDSRVAGFARKRIEQELSEAGFEHSLLAFPAGERNKNLRIFSDLSERMLKLGFDRSACVVAVGGGVTGDIAGFVAGTFMRGIPFIQVPTTLLAMVDSSIGGKVAVDLRSGKNSSGMFHQPAAVLTDTGFLESLPEEEFNNGMAEVVKHGIIRDATYFAFIEKNTGKIKARDPGIIVDLVAGSCRIKADVVARDEKEKGLRRVLNFGHTVGHALESLSRYRLKHGSAVAFGMKKEAEIAVRLGLLKKTDLDRITALLAVFGMKDIPFRAEPLIRSMARDKKNRRGRIVIVLPVKIGRSIVREFGADELIDLLAP